MSRQPSPDPVNFCAACKKQMTRKRFNGVLESNLAFRRRRYCNRQCMAAAMTGVLKRPLTPHTSRKHSARARAAACATCGSTSYLHVHHKDENPLNNELSNLVTLCMSCHIKEHWRIWRETKFQSKPCRHCQKPARHLGLCNTHYTRFRRNGDPLLTRRRENGKWLLVRLSP